MRNKFFDIIVATSKLSKYGIGLNNSLPWNSRKEMNLFKELSINSFFKKDNSNDNIVIMGRNTFESIPEKFRPLKSRINMIISNSYFNDKYNNQNCIWINRNCAYFKSIDDCFKYINDYGEEENLKGDIFVIGGSKIYNQLFDHENLRYVFMSDLKNNKTEDNKFNVDSYLDFNKDNFTKKHIEDNYYTDDEYHYLLHCIYHNYSKKGSLKRSLINLLSKNKFLMKLIINYK